ncbi:MAG: DUF371 domain-containing protein [Candidatus Bathyarchaeia archaeon]
MTRVVELLNAHGHRAVKATHRTTFEITKDERLTSGGDCIIAVGADRGLSELSAEFVRLASRDETTITVTVEACGIVETAIGKGSGLLTFEDEDDVVARKSSFTCGRTLMIRSSKAAVDFSRRLVKRLRDPDTVVKVVLTAQL